MKIYFGTTALLWLSLSFWYTLPDTTNTLEEGLIAHYTFNECDARDDSGNGSDGQLQGNVGCWCGIEDDGLLFDGKHSYLELHGLVNRYFSTSDFTLSFYFKSNQYNVIPQSLFSKKEDCEKRNSLDLRLDQNFQKVYTEIHETPQKSYGDIDPATGGNGWKHFVLVRRGTRAFTYINAIPMKEGRRCSGVDLTNESVLSFSDSPCIQNGQASRFSGVLDEVRVYDRALSDEEVEALYLLHPIEKATQDCVT